MTGSTTAIIFIVVVAMISLTAWLTLVLAAANRPSWKHHSQAPPGVVRGGIHEGDPRSVAPRRDAPAGPAATGPAQPPAGRPRARR